MQKANMMSDLIKSLYQTLLQVAGTVPVRPVASITDKDLPVIVYSASGGVRELFFSGSYGIARTELTVSIYSKSYSQLQELKTNIVNRFHGLSGEVGASEKSTISKASVEGVWDTYDEKLDSAYRAIIQIYVLS